MEKPDNVPYFEVWWKNNKACFLDLPAGWAYYLEVYSPKNANEGLYSDGKMKDPYSFAKSVLDKHLK